MCEVLTAPVATTGVPACFYMLGDPRLRVTSKAGDARCNWKTPLQRTARTDITQGRTGKTRRAPSTGRVFATVIFYSNFLLQRDAKKPHRFHRLRGVSISNPDSISILVGPLSTRPEDTAFMRPDTIAKMPLRTERCPACALPVSRVNRLGDAGSETAPLRRKPARHNRLVSGHTVFLST